MIGIIFNYTVILYDGNNDTFHYHDTQSMYSDEITRLESNVNSGNFTYFLREYARSNSIEDVYDHICGSIILTLSSVTISTAVQTSVPTSSPSLIPTLPPSSSPTESTPQPTRSPTESTPQPTRSPTESTTQPSKTPTKSHKSHSTKSKKDKVEVVVIVVIMIVFIFAGLIGTYYCGYRREQHIPLRDYRDQDGDISFTWIQGGRYT
jgi:hypothetical protein